ncbi:MAG: phage protein [Desulfovibrio sp.]|uniref:phage protein n=1 Tax=Desulfovibrio sp. 7SRBS1 TaxID=3378064 RepID=UPI003B3E3F0A
MQRLSGRNIDVTIGDMRVRVSKATLDITDNSAVASDGGVPNGYVDGDVSASGELELDTANFNLIKEAAKAAGSYRGLEPFDMLFYGKTADEEEEKVEAFGCKLKLSSVLDVDRKGGEKLVRKVTFDVTSPDFVRIGGVPYLRKDETEGLL